MNPLIHKWLEIGNQNTWISRAVDPPQTEKSFTECHTVQELWDKLNHGDWGLGEAFFLGDLCFMNQVDGGYGEWLVIRNKVAFESISFNPERTPIAWWEKFIEAVRMAPESQLVTLEYRNRRRDGP